MCDALEGPKSWGTGAQTAIWALVLCLSRMKHHFGQGHCTSVTSLAGSCKERLSSYTELHKGGKCVQMEEL